MRRAAGTRTRWIARGFVACVLATALGLADVPPAVAADGDLDPSFGDGGTVSLPTLASAGGFAHDVGSGAFVIVGPSAAHETRNAATRRHGDGTLDTSFGRGGTLTHSWPSRLWPEAAADGGIFEATAAVAQDDGGTVVAGAITTNLYGSRVAVARYRPRGKLDGAFGQQGFVLAPSGGLPAAAEQVLIQPDGKILVVGTAFGDPGSEGFVLRFLPDGEPDDSFGVAGRATVAFTGGDFPFTIIRTGALQADGAIVLAGTYVFDNAPSEENAAIVVRLTPAGQLDASFGAGGRVDVRFSPAAEATSVRVTPTGRIFAAGRDGADVVAFALTSTGTLDSSFSDDGKHALTDQAAFRDDETLLLTDDGSLLLIGTAPDEQVRLIRMTDTGALDSSFGSGGVVTGPAGRALDAALDADGNLVVAANTSDGPRLIRFLQAGGSEVSSE